MIWKCGRNKFIPAELEESMAYIKNPYRGWYTLYSFAIHKPTNLEELRWCLKEEESIALILLDLGAYQEKPLDDFALHEITKILQFFLQQGKGVILRPVYDCEGKGMEKEPEEIGQVLQHMEQIGAVLRQKKHSVFLIQGLFIGSWGEMHSSRFASQQHLKRLYEVARNAFGKEMEIAVRTPAIWRKLLSEKELEQGAKHHLGLFNDALFASGTDMGTYGVMTKEAAGWEEPWMRRQELCFAESICSQIPFGGEAVASSESYSVHQLEEMQQLHLSYLNSSYDKQVLDTWKATPYDKECSYYDYIGMKMGYRYVVRNSQMKRRGVLTFEIENVGFGCCPADVELCLKIENGEQQEHFTIKENLKDWKSGEKKEIAVRLKQKEGKIFLAACTQAEKIPIRFANKGSEPLLLGVLSC